jgi:hypothetical protein
VTNPVENPIGYFPNSSILLPLDRLALLYVIEKSFFSYHSPLTRNVKIGYRFGHKPSCNDDVCGRKLFFCKVFQLPLGISVVVNTASDLDES